MTQFIPPKSNRPVVLGVCGASGQIYARWVLKILVEELGISTRVIISNAAKKIIPDELGSENLFEGLPAERIVVEEETNMESELASGSVPTAGMILCPCSLNTLAAVASGISDNLIKRAAQVHLKQRRKLIIAVREMPVGTIDLENMLRLSQAGAVVTPISPPFYHHPVTIDDLAKFTAQKIVQLLIDFDGGIQYAPH
ncbi:MAG: UbiX family flavin prenyltransferase [Phycisphaerae bacterium]